MCIIMSLNVNEMELKDLAQRSWLAPQNEVGRGVWNKKRKEREREMSRLSTLTYFVGT